MPRARRKQQPVLSERATKQEMQSGLASVLLDSMVTCANNRKIYVVMISANMDPDAFPSAKPNTSAIALQPIPTARTMPENIVNFLRQSSVQNKIILKVVSFASTREVAGHLTTHPVAVQKDSPVS